VNGGDLGWFGKGAMVAEFETAAFALENPGDFTLQPVQSQFGYHIIQLIAKQDRPLTSSQFEQARSTFFADWLATVREDYTIETYDEFWIQRVPTEPNFITMATEAADAANTQNAEDAAAVEATATP
jgi:peptidyl-prolyl cis-trans isomerase C